MMHRGRRIKTKGTGTSCGSSTASSVASKNRSRPRGRDRQARARTRHRNTARDVSADSTPPRHKLDVDGSAGRRYRSFVVDDAPSSGDEATGARPARQSQPTVTPRTSHGRHSSCASSVSDGTSATAQSARSVASSNARGRASAAHTYQRLYQASQAKLKVLRAKHERESAQSAVRCDAHGLCRATVATVSLTRFMCLCRHFEKRWRLCKRSMIATTPQLRSCGAKWTYWRRPTKPWRRATTSYGRKSRRT